MTKHASAMRLLLLLVVMVQAFLLWDTNRLLRAANARTDRAMAVAEEWRKNAGRFESINAKNEATLTGCLASLRTIGVR